MIIVSIPVTVKIKETIIYKDYNLTASNKFEMGNIE
jgi:hypothetical protein